MYIKSIHFENVKGFPNIKLDFERPDGTFACWNVFVGGNSSGKSTILRGMALEVYGGDNLFEKGDDGKVVVSRPGVVIIDEVEAHLHPSWQRDIPYWLKSHFPRIQFMVSSHSPLIAQAADPNGLYLLPMQNDTNRVARRATDVEYDRIRWGTAHKTVLGTMAVLSQKVDRWIDQPFQPDVASYFLAGPGRGEDPFATLFKMIADG